MPTLRITSDTSGSLDGIHTQTYEEGEVLECDGQRMSETLGSLLVGAGDAEWVKRESKPVGPDETKPDGPEESKLDGMVVGDYKAPEGSSWKTFYDEDGFELGKAQVSKEDAEKAVDESLTLEQVKAL